ncbi:MAG: hypothetical protein JKY02_08580, partial [Flavobacteriaceae bacterium]|nr:hypothetical protein [Flavobacteriaceae bacterium]
PSERKPIPFSYKAYILDWLSTNTFSKNWLDNLSRVFEQQKGEVLPTWVYSLLQDAFAAESFNLDKQNHDQYLKKIEEALLDSFEINGATKIGKQQLPPFSYETFILEWLSTNKLTGDWLNNLHRDFGEHYRVRLPNWLNLFLLDTLTASKHEQEKQNRNQIIVAITNDLFVSFSKDKKVNEQTDEYEIETSVKTFIAKWLSEHPINENWLHELSVDFERSRGCKMEEWLLKLLQKTAVHNTNNSVLFRNQFIEWISSNLAIELPKPWKNTENKNEWNQLDISVQEYILSWIEEHKLAENWLHKLSIDFEMHHGEELPKLLHTFLKLTYSSIQELGFNFQEHFIESFSSKMKDNSLQNVEPTSKLLKEIDSKEAFANDVIKEFATHNPALDQFISMKEVQGFLFEWIEQKNSLTNWTQLFTSDYKEKYKQPLPYSISILLEKLGESLNENLVVEQQIVSNSITIEPLTFNFIIEWLTEHELNENWIEQLTAAYQNKFSVQFPIWLKHFIEDSFNELSTSLNHSNLNKQFVNYFSKTYKKIKAQKSEKKGIDQITSTTLNTSPLVFIMEWIGKHPLNSKWFYQLSIAFKKTFKKELPIQWQDMVRDTYDAIDKKLDKSDRKKQLLDRLTILFDEQDKSNLTSSTTEQLENEVLNDTNYSFILDWFSNNTLNKNMINQLKLAYRKEFEIALPLWFLDSLERTSVTLSQFKNSSPNKEVFKGVLLTQLNSEEPEGSNKLDSLTKHHYVRETKNSIIEKIESYNEGKPQKKILEWVKWISAIDGPRKYTDWLEILKKKHHRLYETEMSMSDQLIFLELCHDQASLQNINQQGDWTQNLKAQLKAKLQTIKHSENNLDITKSPMEFYQLIKKIPFDNRWFDKVKQLYKKHYKSIMPKEIEMLFFKIQKKKFEMKGNADPFDDSFTAINIDILELKAFLSKRLNKHELSFLTKAIASITKTRSTIWLEEFLQSFQVLSGQELTLETQIALIHFGSTKQRWTPFMVKKKIKKIISNQLDLNTGYDSKKHEAPTRLEVFQFFKKQLVEIKITSDWLDEFTLRYRHAFKESLPETDKKWIVDQLNKETISEKKTLSIHQKTVAHAFLRYIDEYKMHDKAKDLIALFNSFPEQLEESWFAFIIRSYKKVHGFTMPLKLQAVLLDFTQKNSSLTQSLNKEEDILKTKNLLSEALDVEIARIAVEDIKWSKEKLSKIYDWMEMKSWTSMKYEVVKNDYEKHFGTLMPEWMKQILMRYVESNKLKTSNSQPLVNQQSTGKSGQVKRRQKKVSDQAKLLKLRKQIENMKDEKDIPKAEI